MAFIEITTANYLIVHGFDENNKEIVEEITVDKPMKKVVAVSRIQSLSEKYILVTSSHGRMMYWEYTEGYDAVKKMLHSVTKVASATDADSLPF